MRVPWKADTNIELVGLLMQAYLNRIEVSSINEEQYI
jgi:hypothetical protein